MKVNDIFLNTIKKWSNVKYWQLNFLSRVKIPGLNYEEFGKAYKCTQGEDKMYPEAKDTTRVW